MTRVLFLALALSGCAVPRAQRGELVRTIKTAAAPRRIPVFCDSCLHSMTVWGTPKPALGVTYLDLRTTVAVKVGLCADAMTERDVMLRRNIAAHELGHVLGLDHGCDPSAWMYPTQDCGRPLIKAPTPEELAAARGCPFFFVLVTDATVTWEYRLALRWAASAWNEALGQRVLTFASDEGG